LLFSSFRFFVFRRFVVSFRARIRHPICLRFADGGIPIACRYLATVRRAILICLARSISAIA
jgi:hypothetical protein